MALTPEERYHELVLDLQVICGLAPITPYARADALQGM